MLRLTSLVGALVPLTLLIVSSCGGNIEDPVDPVVVEESWHARWVQDSCARCPKCCTQSDPEGNVAAYLDDGAVCLEENLDRISEDFSKKDLENYCKGEIMLPERP